MKNISFEAFAGNENQIGGQVLLMWWKWRNRWALGHFDKTSPKYAFSVPYIDKLVDNTAGHAMLSFMGCLLG